MGGVNWAMQLASLVFGIFSLQHCSLLSRRNKFTLIGNDVVSNCKIIPIRVKNTVNEMTLRSFGTFAVFADISARSSRIFFQVNSNNNMLYFHLYTINDHNMPRISASNFQIPNSKNSGRYVLVESPESERKSVSRLTQTQLVLIVCTKHEKLLLHTKMRQAGHHFFF